MNDPTLPPGPFKKLIAFLVANGGKPAGKTWPDLAEEFGITAADEAKAKAGGPRHERYAAGQRARMRWMRYQKRSPRDLVVVKETYRRGELVNETFKRRPDQIDAAQIDSDAFELAGYTTSPTGGTWAKWQRKRFDSSQIDESAIDRLVERVKGLTVIPPEAELPPRAPELVVYNIADRHIGATTKAGSVYSNVYDAAERRRRHDQIVEHLRRTIATYGAVGEVQFFDLGDGVDGLDAKTTRRSPHTLPQDLDNRGQFEEYVELTSGLLQAAVQMPGTGRVRFASASNSNHGGDFEYFAARTVARLGEAIGYDGYVAIRHVDHRWIGGRPYVFLHGKDSEDLKHGLPLHLNDKAERYLADYIRANDLDRSPYKVQVVKGDLHSYALDEAYGFTYTNCPSMMGSTKWIHTNFGRQYAATLAHIWMPGDMSPRSDMIHHSHDTIAQN